MACFRKTLALLVMLLSTMVTGLVFPSLNASYYNTSIADPPIKAPAAPRYTWWIDESCNNVPEFRAIFKEARDMACLAKKKLASETDRDFERVFQYTFHVPKSSWDKYPHAKIWKDRMKKATRRTPLEHANCEFLL